MWLNERSHYLIKPKNFVLGSMGFILGVGVIYLLSCYIQIIVSETDSHPKHYFLHLKFYKPKLGDHSLIYSKWYGKKIIKKIVGIEGDKIWYDKEHCLWIRNQKIGFQKPIAKDLRGLTPIKAQIIPKGYVFVHSEHISSFDSRYQELGLIPMDSLEGKIIPLI